MKNYGEMSDFEINLAVAHIVIGSGGYDWNSDKKEVYLAARDGGEFLPNAYFDPCNNPADAWNIIEQSKISLIMHEDHIDGMPWFACRGKLNSSNKKPLRAAMIVFLMMQESKL